MLRQNEEVVHVVWTPALEDAPVGKLIDLTGDPDVPLAIRLAIHKELCWRLEEIAARMPQTAEVIVKVIAGGHQYEAA
jgi:hypothetical protein